jgi:small subunit ribosomal protein S17
MTEIDKEVEQAVQESAGQASADAVQKTRGIRKSRNGKVISKSGDKTIVVLVERRYHHPLYGKQLVDQKKMHTHDENNEAVVGDMVMIQECRPLSRKKRWRLIEVINKEVPAAVEGENKQ